MTTAATYPTPSSSLPDLNFIWTDAANNIIDFSAPGWSFRMVISRPPNAAVVTKTTGILGLNSSPNVIVQWAVGELSALKPGRWYFQLTATYGPAGGKQRILTGSLVIDQSTVA